MGIKKEIYIIASAFFLLAVLLAVFFVYPLLKEIRQQSKELTVQRNSKIILESQFSEAEKFRQKYENYQPNLAKIDALFIDSRNPVTFIEFLESLASDSQIELQISTPSPSKEGQATYENFQLSALGNFSKILKFLRKIEAGSYLIKTQNLNIENFKLDQKSKKQPNMVTMNFSIKVFSK